MTIVKTRNRIKEYAVFCGVLFLIFPLLMKISAIAVPLSNLYEIEPTVKCTIARDKDNNVLGMQGVYFFIKNNKHYAIYSGWKADSEPTVLTLVDLDTCTVLDKNNNAIMEHANDIAYNNRDGKFYVTSASIENKLYFSFTLSNNRIIIDPETIQGTRMAGLDYDNDKNRYLGYSDGWFYSFPSLSSVGTEVIKLSTVPFSYDDIDNGNTALTSQGISYFNGNLYYARTVSVSSSPYNNDSFVSVFDADSGKYKYTMHFPSSLFEGHLEGITVIGDEIYFGINASTPSQNQSFLVYKGVNSIEEDYLEQHRQTVTFNKSSIQKTYGDAKFINLATTTGDGTIAYNSSNSNVATVNSTSGEVTIKGIGSATITATATETDNYLAASATYTLTVSGIQYELSFNNNGGSGSVESIKCTTSNVSLDHCAVTVPNVTLTKEGYDFLGWSDNQNSTTTTYRAKDIINLSNNKTIYAVWAEKDNNPSQDTPPEDDENDTDEDDNTPQDITPEDDKNGTEDSTTDEVNTKSTTDEITVPDTGNMTNEEYYSNNQYLIGLVSIIIITTSFVIKRRIRARHGIHFNN